VHWLIWVLRPVERLALRAGATADFFNVLGVVLAAAGGVLVARGSLEAGGWVIAAGGLCDLLDGRMARARGQSSPYGMFIDSVLDRFAELFALLGFAWYLRTFPGGPLAVGGAIGGSLLVSYARARGESLQVVGKAGFMRRGERLALIVLTCLLDAPVTAAFGWRSGSVVLLGMTILAIGTLLTAAHRTVWIARRLREAGRSDVRLG
jgi:CDP-diacylglycerol--glycerol-3-phosphate 3-phosphatidyltransferase